MQVTDWHYGKNFLLHVPFDLQTGAPGPLGDDGRTINSYTIETIDEGSLPGYALF